MKIVVVLAAALVCAACTGQPVPTTTTAPASADSVTRAEFIALKYRLESLQREIYSKNLSDKLALHDTAEFDPAEQSFRVLYNDIGRFAIVLESVAPQADGVRIKLRVGNLTSATCNGGSVHVQWGPRQPDASKDTTGDESTKWAADLKDADMQFTESLLPGKWNVVTLTLPGTPPEKFGYMELSKLTTDQIALYH